jgi:hypothetical protein
MKILKEVTNWDLDYNIGGHTYFVNDSKDKMYAYIKSSGTEVERFRIPIKFSVSRRKFKEVPNTFDYSVDDKPLGRTWTVTGSRGDSYTVSENNGEWTCTCPASKWQKGDCKHIKSLNPVS